jgi:peroxiredoxin (alkyl hydroperoxide reductase subunit C)
MSIEVGSEAPDFTLKDSDGNEVTLSSFRGKDSVTLVFIPFAFTGVCQGELCELRDNLHAFEHVTNQVLSISCDTRHALKVWKEQQGFTFPMLSDFWPHGATAQAYDCFNPDLGCAMRRTVVVGKDGVITDIFQSGGLGEARNLDSYTEALTHVRA